MCLYSLYLGLTVFPVKLLSGRSIYDIGNVGALVVRIGLWGILYYTYNQEPPTIVLVIIYARMAHGALGKPMVCQCTRVEISVVEGTSSPMIP